MSERITYFPIESRNTEFSVPQVILNVHKKEIAPFTGNSILYATSESRTEVAIKISTNSGSTQREWKGLNMTYGAGLSVPKPYALAKNKDGEKLLISEKIEGELLYTSNNARLRIDLGKITRDMHDKVPVSGTGWSSSGKTDFSYYSELLRKYLGSPLNELQSNSETQVILNKLSDTMLNYCGNAIPVFNHNDIHDGQAIVKRVNKNFDAFLNGYLDSNDLTDTEKSVMTFYILFISTRAIDYLQNIKSRYLERARETHKKVLRFINSERLWKDY